MNAKLTPLEFETIDEHWNVYLLSDGTKLREKHVLLSIARTDTYDALGRPIYQPSLFTFFVPLAPEELRGEPSNVVPSPRALVEAGMEAVRVEKVEYDEPNIYKLEDGTIASFKITIRTKASPLLEAGMLNYSVLANVFLMKKAKVFIFLISIK